MTSLVICKGSCYWKGVHTSDAQRPAQANLVCLQGGLDQEGHSAACMLEQVELFVFGFVLCFFPCTL